MKRLYFIAITFLLMCHFEATSQSGQYKVVCDRATRMIKIVPLEDRSAGHVPIQSGFSSKESAEEWVDKKFNTLECDPDKQIQENQLKAQQTHQRQQNSTQPSHAGKLPNGRFYISYSNSNLDDILFLTDAKSTKGIMVGIEGMVGQTVYGVFGTVFHAYGGLLEKIPDGLEESTVLLGLKIPVLIGIRTPLKLPYSFAAEAGIGWHPVISSTNGNTTLQFLEPVDHQFSGNVRLKAGFTHVSVLAQYETFFTDFFKDEDFQLNLLSIGLNIEF